MTLSKCHNKLRLIVKNVTRKLFECGLKIVEPLFRPYYLELTSQSTEAMVRKLSFYSAYQGSWQGRPAVGSKLSYWLQRRIVEPINIAAPGFKCQGVV